MDERTIVSADWLREHLGEPGLVVLDARFSLDDEEWGERAYLEGHIPGACYADTATHLAGEIIPGKLVYRLATVGDREYARRLAKHGEKFDNAKYGCALISRCVLEPQVPPMEADKLQKKNGKEMDRLLSAILGEGGEDPQ